MLDPTDTLLRLAAAAVIGGAIGLNRDLHHKPSGLRTLALVSLGSAVAVMIAAEAGTGPNPVSPVLQGIVTGVGFLGAGVILHNGTAGKVHGLTTAAAIWLTAVLGAACGLGFWQAAITAAVITGLILSFGGRLEKAVHFWFDGRDAAPGNEPRDRAPPNP